MTGEASSPSTNKPHNGEAGSTALAASKETVEPRLQLEPEVARSRAQHFLSALEARDCARVARLLANDPALAQESWRHKKLSALLIAAERGDEAMVRLLLPWSAPNAMDAEGFTALMGAVFRGHLNCTQLLIPHSDCSCQDQEGNTALLHAVQQGHGAIARELLMVSDPSATNNKNENALMLAAAGGNVDCLRLFLGKIPLTLRSREGKDALFLAVEHRHLDVIKVILNLYREHQEPWQIVEQARDSRGRSATEWIMDEQWWEGFDCFAQWISERRLHQALRRAPNALPQCKARFEREQLQAAIGINREGAATLHCAAQELYPSVMWTQKASKTQCKSRVRPPL